MTINIRRLAGALATLGTELEEKGDKALATFAGWREGPRPAPREGTDELCTCGHVAYSHYLDAGPCMHTLDSWVCPCMGFEPGAVGTTGDDQRENRKRETRAARQYDEYLADLRTIDQAIQRINRRHDMALPPDMNELRNRRTGEFDPETATDMLAAGWCPNCFTNGLGSVPLAPVEGKSQLRRYSDRCRPCGDFRRAEGIDKPKEIAQAHAEGRRLSTADMEKIVAREKAKLAPKKTKRKKGRKAA